MGWQGDHTANGPNSQLGYRPRRQKHVHTVPTVPTRPATPDYVPKFGVSYATERMHKPAPRQPHGATASN